MIKPGTPRLVEQIYMSKRIGYTIQIWRELTGWCDYACYERIDSAVSKYKELLKEFEGSTVVKTTVIEGPDSVDEVC